MIVETFIAIAGALALKSALDRRSTHCSGLSDGQRQERIALVTQSRALDLELERAYELSGRSRGPLKTFIDQRPAYRKGMSESEMRQQGHLPPLGMSNEEFAVSIISKTR